MECYQLTSSSKQTRLVQPKFCTTQFDNNESTNKPKKNLKSKRTQKKLCAAGTKLFIELFKVFFYYFIFTLVRCIRWQQQSSQQQIEYAQKPSWSQSSSSCAHCLLLMTLTQQCVQQQFNIPMGKMDFCAKFWR